jgi:hypothetical protein
MQEGIKSDGLQAGSRITDPLSGVKCLKLVGVGLLPQPSSYKGHQSLYIRWRWLI